MYAFDMSIPVGHYVETEQEAEQWLKYFLDAHDRNNGLGIDSETTGFTRHKDVVLYWSLSDAQYRICLPADFIPLFKDRLLENPKINFDFTNAPYDAHMFANTGANLSKAGMWRDTRVQSWLKNENNLGRHGLKECTKDHFQRETPDFEDIFGKVPPKKINKVTGQNMNKTVGDLIRMVMTSPTERTKGADYASLDAYNSTCLRSYFDGVLKKEQMYDGVTLFDFFYSVAAPFTKVLWKMERRGVTLDKGYLMEKQGPMKAEMDRIEKEFAKAAGQLLNLNSTNDVKWFFFDLLKKEPIKWTKGGASGNKQPSTDAEVLEEWAGQDDPWAKLLIKHRGVSKIYGTYVLSLQELIDGNYRIHTSLNQIGTVTGRLSSSDPNLQNIPRFNEDRFGIRDAFIPGDRKVLVVADYAQLEMRLMAHFSGDEKMIKAILDGIDLHCLTVSEMNGIPYDDVIAAVKAEKAIKKGTRTEPLTPREEELLFMRQAAKATGFGIIYGIGGARLAANLTREGTRLVSEEEGFRLIKKWFGVFPGVEAYIQATHAYLWQEGKVQTIMGRWRRFGDLRGMSKRDSAQCQRQAVNSVIQGSAADIADMAMITAENDPELNELGAELLLQVHDELMWECPDDPEVITNVKRRAKEIMELPFGRELKVPLPVEVGHGYSWASAK
jgi:DNA polymerase-1